MKEIFELLKQVLNREFIRAVLSNPRTKDGVVKAKVRPLEKNGDFMFQVEKFTKTQAFHENINCKDAAEILAGHMENFPADADRDCSGGIYGSCEQERKNFDQAEKPKKRGASGRAFT